ncbi:lysosome-associated membrane glycoprotein 2 isoform X1 [Serinus canaria]|uniref:lysosome-associated membrane glycoprotein 2 isoform X1 n=1 Tax=Serinus canaria TaxID=9135 RepID=UPI0011AE48F5|nr:lysosome-associated membrane glycoprotein 2 isoform X1 [Serinus canaria]
MTASEVFVAPARPGRSPCPGVPAAGSSSSTAAMGPRRSAASSRGRLLLPLLLLGVSGFFQSYAVEVDIKDASNATCLYANWMMRFLITYESNNGDYKTTTLNLSSSVTHNGSVCGNDTQAAVVAVQFGEGHSWSINITKTNETYQGDFITLTYNTNDTAVFPDAKRKGPVTVLMKDPAHPVQLNTVFVCHNSLVIEEKNTTQIFWNVTLQAFVQNGTVSKKETRCPADTPTSAPTVPPTIANVTTASTTTLSPAPTTVPKPVENPDTGNYSLKSGNKTCFLATVGLQLNVSQDKPLLININPKTTVADGACGNTTATLKLNDGNSTLIGFTFAIKNTSASVQKFYLREVNVTLLNHLNGSVISSADNNNLSKWDAFLGSSYMCRKEQTLQINENVQVHTFNLWIQPFLVEANKFATAEECIADSDLNFLIPIAVGVALGFLIILVFIFYIIGRRKSRTGYQSV